MQNFNQIVINDIVEKHDKADWFDLCDVVFTQFILDTPIFDTQKLLEIKDTIFSSADENGYIHPHNSKKSHNKYHSTAYGLASLCLISELTGDKIDTAPLLTKVLSNLDVTRAMPENFSAVDKLHVWRASHTFGGISAILEFAKAQGLIDSNSVLDSYIKSINKLGLWGFSNPVFQLAFDVLYSIKHNPTYAKYGGAAHLYWHMDTIPTTVDKERAIKAILKFYRNKTILEKIPYCLDYDVLFMLRLLCKSGGVSTQLTDKVNEVFFNVGCSLVEYLTNKNADLWVHAYPGALAAIEVCTFSSKFKSQLEASDIKLKDVMEYTVWL